MEHVIDELNYWTDLMTRWKNGWIAGSEHKANGKNTSLIAQSYITPPDYETLKFRSLLLQEGDSTGAAECSQ
jgi:hypothetical protein